MNHKRSEMNGFTRVVIFEVKPHLQQRLAGLLSKAIETHVQSLPGFLYARLICSTDGTRVINYARWTGEAEWLAMESNPMIGAAFSEAFRLASHAILGSYEQCAYIEGKVEKI